jgi:hypothetical protein
MHMQFNSCKTNLLTYGIPTIDIESQSQMLQYVLVVDMLPHLSHIGTW